jgi:hypothetical protein
MVEWGSAYTVTNDIWGCSWPKKENIRRNHPIHRFELIKKSALLSPPQPTLIMCHPFRHFRQRLLVEAGQPRANLVIERREPTLIEMSWPKEGAEDRTDEPAIAIGIITLGQLIVEVWAILITVQTYGCSLSST